MIIPCVGTRAYREWRKQATAPATRAAPKPRELIYREIPKAVSVEDIVAAYRKAFDSDPPPDVLDRPRITIVQIIEEICVKHRISRNVLLSDRRNPNLVRARDEVMWRAREETLLSYPQIGRALHRDHSSCITGARRHEQRISAPVASHAAMCAEG